MRPAPELSNETKTPCIKLNLFAELPFTVRILCKLVKVPCELSESLNSCLTFQSPRSPVGRDWKLPRKGQKKKLERAGLRPIENEFLASRSSFELPSRPQTWEFPARSQAATSTLSPRCVHRKWISADASGSHLRLFDLGSKFFPKMPKKAEKTNIARCREAAIEMRAKSEQSAFAILALIESSPGTHHTSRG